ncbi:MAG: PfkB family carbohydrate kinase [Proteobacteria bacterium]|jgi:pseudouridine kinase|nr:PfkB family carbohydrate kinase [Pseudomonadota bacterium]
MSIDLPNKNKPYAVIIGGANMDICGAPSNTFRVQDSNPGTVTLSPGGVARNIAENLALLGVQCRLIAAIGSDHYGDILLEQGQSAGIDMHYMVRLKGQKTSTYLSILDDTGDMHIAINDMVIADLLKPKHLRAHETMIKRASLIIADTNLSKETLAYLTETFAGQHLIIDGVSTTKVARIKPYLNSVHSLKVNGSEAEALCGMRLSKDDMMPKMADWFHEQGIKRVFITLGPKGVFYSDMTERGIITTHNQAKSVVNASGAGDAFVAGIAYAMLQNWDIIGSVQFAVSAANVAMNHQSTINPAMSLAAVNKVREFEYDR